MPRRMEQGEPPLRKRADQLDQVAASIQAGGDPTELLVGAGLRSFLAYEEEALIDLLRRAAKTLRGESLAS